MDSMIGQLAKAIDFGLNILVWLVVINAVLSWFPRARWHPAGRFVTNLVEPMLRPIRNMMRTSAGGVDFSPMVLIVIIWVVRAVVSQGLASLAR